MKNFDTRAYSITDFLEWSTTDILQISPDFQRRSVWSSKAKSYLIDTILRGKPIPKIIITQKLEGGRTIRTVVDGQQRLRTIIEFANDAFTMSRAHNKELAGKKFSSLSEDMQRAFFEYELGVDVLFNLPYEDILDIFARLNSYTVQLGPQEKINAAYLGFFKQYAFKFGFKYVNYFLGCKVLTKKTVSRMGEAELAGDLLVSLIDGVQTNKNAIKFYKLYDDDETPLVDAAKKFDDIMSYIGTMYSAEELGNTNWSRPQLFYTLFTSIGHGLFGIGGIKESLRFPLKPKLVDRCRDALNEISDAYDEYTGSNPSEIPESYEKFIAQSRRGTTDTGTRQERTEFVCRALSKALK